jgi:flavin reductase (DIM6/NTAB) family NADH-FMN oxidoreductase RutF
VMAAAWNSALDFEPAKVMVVVDKSTFTRQLIEASGEFALSVPTQNVAQLTTRVGSQSGRAMDDKLSALDVPHFFGEKTKAPLIQGCAGWLECKLLDEPELARKYDMLIGEVLAAWADPRVFTNNRWHFDDEQFPGMRTIHHISSGTYFLAGDQIATK